MRGTVYAPKKPIRDYSKKQFDGNPLFPRRGGSSSSVGHKKISSKSPIRALLAMMACSGIGLFLFGYAVWGAPLQLTEITIEGATPATERRIRNILESQRTAKILGILPQSNTLLFRISKLDTALRGAFFFDTLTLRKKLPHSLVVTVVERDAQAAFITDTKLFALDGGCTIIRELTTEEVAGLPFLPTGVEAVTIPNVVDSSASDVSSAPNADAVQSPSSAEPLPLPPLPRNTMPVITLPVTAVNAAPGKTICSTETLSFVKEVFTSLRETAKSEPLWFIPDDEAQSLDVMMEGDWHVFLSSSLPFAPQAERLAVVLREKIGKDKNRLKYVDLRYNETVFFRLK